MKPQNARDLRHEFIQFIDMLGGIKVTKLQIPSKKGRPPAYVIRFEFKAKPKYEGITFLKALAEAENGFTLEKGKVIRVVLLDKKLRDSWHIVFAKLKKERAKYALLFSQEETEYFGFLARNNVLNT